MEKEFTFRLNRFAGCHFSDHASFALEDGESPDMVNFKINDGFCLEKRAGYTRVLESQDPIRGVWYGKREGKDCYLVVRGNTLFHSETGFADVTAVSGEEIPGEEKVFFFPFSRSIYLLTGTQIMKYTGDQVSVPEPYAPLVMTSTTPSGNGTLFEEPNLLGNKMRQLFSPDGESYVFVPALRGIYGVSEVKENGRVIPDTRYYWDISIQALQLLYLPRRGYDTLEVTYLVERDEEAAKRINECRFAVSFGGASDTRAFLYGNPNTPAIRYHSGMVDGEPSLEYFPENAYTFVGSGAPITAIMRHYDRQIIFTENAAYYSYLEYLTGENGKLIASFPVFPLSDDRGSLPPGQALLIENTPCSFNKEGLFRWVSTNIRDERNAVCISQAIAQRLRQEDASRAILFHRKANSELFICCQGHLYIYNYRLKVFYYYEIPDASGFFEVEGVLYFFDASSIFVVGGTTDDGAPISAVWSSKTFSFQNPLKKKNLHRFLLYAKAPDGASAEIRLDADGGARSETKEIAFSAGEQSSVDLRITKRHFFLLGIRMETQGTQPLILIGAEWKGRITDEH